MRLKDKVCIVTGGGSGIGRATCRVFAREGAKVVVADRKPEAAAAVARELPGAIALSVDVSKSAEVKRMVDDTLKAFGRLDVIVNNAGYGTFGTVVDIDEQEWDDLMAVNVRGV
ncbi:MAG: SDR family NAD(P)-dependent oxidoreductase, partial [Alphaproteobacteria bacterium]|nr:SDR family NAD(P)-dependent oxidoreductase [Alphaproteobacteria bacterium]